MDIGLASQAALQDGRAIKNRSLFKNGKSEMMRRGWV